MKSIVTYPPEAPVINAKRPIKLLSDILSAGSVGDGGEELMVKEDLTFN